MELGIQNLTLNCNNSKGLFKSIFHLPSSEEELPYYFIGDLWPYFVGLVFTEYIALAMKGKGPRLGETLNSLGHGILSETAKILTFGIEVWIYAWIHRKFRIVDLPWDSPVTWYIAFLGVDFAYYWAHRATHEVNFLWAQHQVHHSSEDFNIAVSVRHPISHSWINSLFYLPLAFFIPTPHSMAHQQFTLIYQAWLHTPLVGKLGPLEYILNTPTHHSVHHGCNIYTLDKNFGGFLIIWDRIFRTFQDIKEDEELVYGIVFQHESFNPFWQLWHKFPGMWNRCRELNSWVDRFKVVFYGPSWIPGVDAPRLGRDEDKVDIRPRPKFHVDLPVWIQLYLLIHFLSLTGLFHEFVTNNGTMNQLSICLTLCFFISTLTTIGLLSEGNSWGPPLEIFRCLFFLPLFLPPSSKSIASFIFIPSAFIWIYYGGKTPIIKQNTK